MKRPANESSARPSRQLQLPVATVRKLLHRGARFNLSKLFGGVHPVDAARLFPLLTPAERNRLFGAMLDEFEIAHVAQIVGELEIDDAVALLRPLPPASIARLVAELPPNDATSITSNLPKEIADEVLAVMEAESAAEVRALLEHEERTAGRLMTTDFLSLGESMTVAQAITTLQDHAEEAETLLYLYVVDADERLTGVLSMRQLLTTPPGATLGSIMVRDVIRAQTETPQEQVAQLVAEYNLLAIPITDDDERLVGIVTVDDVIDVLQEEASRELRGLAGVSADDRVTTPFLRSLRLRSPWLLVNLCTASVAAIVISLFEGSIRQLPTLAALMPIVAGVGGNGATQTLAVVVRGLALGELTHVPWTVVKEALVGLGNGLINGFVVAAFAAFYYGNPLLGIVLGCALTANLTVAGFMGTLVPVTLKRLGIDPAVASGVFVTASTDVIGFFSFLGLATLMLRWLQP